MWALCIKIDYVNSFDHHPLEKFWIQNSFSCLNYSTHDNMCGLTKKINRLLSSKIYMYRL